jgi:exopolysaccharide biosynthesis polyprenyl glycosylphosphotransferase
MTSGIYKKSLLLPVVKICLDIVTITGAIIGSYYVRFFSPLKVIFPITKGIPEITGYFYFAMLLLLFFLGMLAMQQSYHTRAYNSFAREVTLILKCCFFGILFAMSSAFLYRGFSYSRLVFILIFFNTTIFLLVQRYLFHQLKTYFLKKGYGVINLFLIGSENLILEFNKHFKKSGLNFLKVHSYFSEKSIADIDLPYSGTFENLKQAFQGKTIDGLVIAFNQSEHHRLREIFTLTEGKNIDLFYYPEFLDLITSNVQLLELKGLFLLKLKSFPLAGWQGLIKRFIDFLISLLVLILFSPLFVLIALLIKVSSRGPVFYRQKRIGLDQIEFTMVKFRSMMTNAEDKTGPVWAEKTDQRVTMVGKILRRTSLDELPQLYNVLKGDMSLVGPRPERKYFVEQFRSMIPKYSERHRFRSGMTGWAQVNGLRGQSPIEERTRYDLFYIENWSLWLDIKIIILTFIAILKGDNAY